MGVLLPVNSTLFPANIAQSMYAAFDCGDIAGVLAQFREYTDTLAVAIAGDAVPATH